MSDSVIVVTDYDFDDVEIERGVVEGAGLEFRALQAKSEGDVLVGAPDATSLITQYAYIGREVMDGLPGLRHIARYGVGTDIVDVEYATAKGVVVTNVPADYCRNEVADHALAMMLSFARGLVEYDAATRAGTWRWQSAAPLHRLAACTVGIIGLGNIGRSIADRCLAFGSRVVAYDPYAVAAGHVVPGVGWASLDDLLATADYVIVQAPLTPETRGLIGEAAISRMKRGAVLINTSRGPIVDTAAVRSAILSGHIRGAGFDDLPEEPAKQRDWHPADPLFGTPRTLITPHAAYYSEESLAFCREFAAGEAVRLAFGQPLLSPVNLHRLPSAPTEGALTE
jgi:D-3-phosphoglycerate dehydrogenase